MNKALVTGANGFIGHHLVERLLDAGVSVRALVRDRSTLPSWSTRVDLVVGDIRDSSAMMTATAGVDTVFHLAGKVHALSELKDEDGSYQSINVEGTRNLLEGAAKGGVRAFVFFSSVSAMGKSSPGCLDESSHSRPTTPYGRSKLSEETLVLDYGKKNGFHAVCLRPPLVYGPTKKGNLFRMIRMIDRGLFPPLPDLGNHHSLVHVANVVEAAVLAATNPAANGKCYIVTDSRPYSTRELCQLISRHLGKPVRQWHVPLWILKSAASVGDVIGRLRKRRFPLDSDALEKLLGEVWYSSEKISRELGYRPTVDFENALPKLLDWYRKSRL